MGLTSLYIYIFIAHSIPTPPLSSSCLFHVSNTHLSHIFLSFMARFCSRTLLAAQIMEGVLHKACDSAIEYLLEHNFIVKSGGSGEGCVDYNLAPTQLGRVKAVKHTIYCTKML